MSVKRRPAIREAPPPSFTPPDHFSSSTGQIPLHLLPLHNATFFRVLCNSRVLTGGSGIETGIDWVTPVYHFRASTRILGLNIEASIDWVNPRVPLRAYVHSLDRIVSILSSIELSVSN